MQTATVVCGSGDRNGISRRACLIMEEALLEKGYDVFFFEPAYMEIGHCKDCDGCRTGRCVIADDMNLIYDAFSKSDLMVFAAPIHFSGPSSIIKIVMDRFQKCWFDSESGHPARFFACLCGGSPKPNFEPTEKIFKAFCITTRMDYSGTLEIPDTDAGVPDLEGTVQSFISEKV